MGRVDAPLTPATRARRRRRRRAARQALSVTALVALAGVPATGVAAAKLFGGGEGGATATAAAAEHLAGEQHAQRPAPPLAASDVPAKQAEPAPHAAIRTAAALKPAAQPDLGVTGLQRELGLPVDGVAGPQVRAGARSTTARCSSASARHAAIATKPYTYGGGQGSFNAPGYDC